MNLKHTEKLLKLLKAQGVSHFKSLEVEIRFDAQPSSVQPSATYPNAEVESQAVPVPATGAAIPPVEMKIPHHLNEVVSLLKLSDDELVEKLFPDPSQMPQEGE